MSEQDQPIPEDEKNPSDVPGRNHGPPKDEGVKDEKVRSMKYVIVATRSRPWSIFAGELVEHSPQSQSVTLANVRMIAYFSADSRTVVGVAERGVTSAARVSPRIDRGTFYGVEMILDATPESRASIEEEPWG